MTVQAGEGERHVVVTGGAGYIGSVLVGALLRGGWWVTVVDDLLFGGDSLLAYQPDPAFHFIKGDVCRARAVKRAAQEAARRGAPSPAAVVHLAAIVGFPACQAVGRERVWETNTEAVARVFEEAEAVGCERMVLASTYSTYGQSLDGRPVDEDSPLRPQSLYAETKVAAEMVLREAGATARCAPLVFRLATVFGVSPRMRFDLIINQFVYEAYSRGELRIFQRDYSRSFIHVRDVAAGILLGLKAPLERIRGETYNLGSDEANHTKDEIVALVRRALPETRVRHEKRSFGGDMRDVRVSYAKVREGLGFVPQINVEQGIAEVLGLLRSGLIRDPDSERYRNARPLLN